MVIPIDDIKKCLIYSALLILTVIGGGFFWQQGIIPFALLLFCFILNQKSFSVNLLYLAPMFFFIPSAVNTLGNFQNGIYEAEKLSLYFFGICVGTAGFREKDFFYAVFLAGMLVSFFGLAAYFGIVPAEEFVFFDRGISRLQSFVKYANTAACLLGVGYISLMYIYSINWKKEYFVSGILIFTALILTFSKAFIPIFMLICLFVVLKKDNLRTFFLIQFLTSAFCAAAAAVSVKLNVKIFGFIVFMAVISLSVKLSEVKFKNPLKILCSFYAAGALLFALLIIFKPELGLTFEKRLIYSKDALKLFFARPFFGCGPGSWEVLQFGVQSMQYSVKYMHNGILQLFVECGAFFGVLFFGGIAYAAYLTFKEKKYFMFAVIAAIIIHSFFDFDLSFSLMLLILSIATGFAAQNTGIKISQKINGMFFCFLVLFFSANLLYMSTEWVLRSDFERLVSSGNFAEAEKKSEKLLMLCPKDSDLRLNLAAIKEKTNKPKSETESELEKAVKLSPNDPQIYKAYMKYDKNISALNHIKHYISLAPKQEDAYTEAKKYADSLKENGEISVDEYEKITEFINSERKNRNVVDRNKLLRDLVNQEKN